MQLQRCTSQVNWKEETNLCAIHFLVAATFVTVDKSQERISLHNAPSYRQHRVPQLVLCIGAGGFNRAKDTNIAKIRLLYTLGRNNHILGPTYAPWHVCCLCHGADMNMSASADSVGEAIPNQKCTVQTDFDPPKIYPNIYPQFGTFLPLKYVAKRVWLKIKVATSLIIVVHFQCSWPAGQEDKYEYVCTARAAVSTIHYTPMV